MRYETKSFGTHVRSLRKARGRTQAELAEKSGLSEDTIRRIERGDFTGSIETVDKIAHGLGLGLSTLFESYELNEFDDHRALLGLVTGRSPAEVRLILRIVELIVDEIDLLERR